MEKRCSKCGGTGPFTRDSRRVPGVIPLSQATLTKRVRRDIRVKSSQAFLVSGLALVGTRPDTEIAGEFGIHPSTVRKHRKNIGVEAYPQPTEWALILGRLPDNIIAEQFGKHPEVVRRKRTQLGIPIYIRPMPEPLGVHLVRPWHELAGTMLDKDVAKIFDISKSAVSWYRKRMGILAFKYRDAA
jgi:hypothetical protein